MARGLKFACRLSLALVTCVLCLVAIGRFGEHVVSAPQVARQHGDGALAPHFESDNKRRDDAEEEPTSGTSLERGNTSPWNSIVLAVVVCGDRVNETLVMLKSAVALSQTPLHFAIVAEVGLKEIIHKKLYEWPLSIWQRISYKIYPITFPFESNVEEWKKLFKPCAAQRLFLPSLLKDVDSILYVDTDVLFLRPLEHLWYYFSQMNSSHMAAMTPEHEDFATGWYNRFARHPYFKPLGVNSGVMLMNLTRMRDFNWQSHVIPIYEKYKYKITWGDQDIINIIFYLHPEKLFVYSCEWNFRSDHCMYMSVCKQAEENGVGVLHGNRAVFHTDKQPAFKAVYETFQAYKLGSSLKTELVLPMEQALKKTLHTNCGKLYRIFLKAFIK